MWQRFTERLKRAVYYSQEEAGSYGVWEVTPEHLLLGIIREKENIAGQIFNALRTPIDRIKAEIRSVSTTAAGNPWVLKEGVKSEMVLSDRAKRVIDLAYQEARSQSVDQINTGHILIGILRESGSASRILQEKGITTEMVSALLKSAKSENDTPEKT